MVLLFFISKSITHQPTHPPTDQFQEMLSHLKMGFKTFLPNIFCSYFQEVLYTYTKLSSHHITFISSSFCLSCCHRWVKFNYHLFLWTPGCSRTNIFHVWTNTKICFTSLLWNLLIHTICSCVKLPINMFY